LLVKIVCYVDNNNDESVGCDRLTWRDCWIQMHGFIFTSQTYTIY